MITPYSVHGSMITGVILAGGMSTRMGKEKGLAQLAGVPLVTRVAKVVTTVADEITISVSPGMSHAYRRTLGHACSIVEDLRAEIGPVEGMVRALGRSKGDFCIVVPCDTPLVSADVCRLLVDASSGKDGSVPRVRGYFEPLHCVLHRKKAVKALEASISEGKRKPMDALTGLDLAVVEEEALRTVDPELLSFWNLNTLQELERAEEYLSSRP